MSVRLPSTDARRAADLRAELDRSGSATVPGWGVAAAPGSFGRALVEIAAVLAEQTSSRLDRTAERDALAFADTLDIPPPAPQAASAVLVLVPEESRTTPTSAPTRVQVGAAMKGGEVIFETTRALDVSPARIAEVVAVDPDTDHIERAPGPVFATAAPPAPVGGRQVVTAASAGSTVVQVAPAITLEPGDQVRIQGTAYRIRAVSQDLVTLVDPLTAPVPAGTSLEEIEVLESFTLRDLQQHACYVGHASLFNLDRPARIELVLTPTGLARRLSALDLRYSLWGTAAGDDEPAWHALDAMGASASTLSLRKAWEGSVDEVEVEGRKNRWLRIEHPDPITTVGVVDPADHVALRLRSEPVPTTTPAPIGSTTITNAFHNAVPLAVTGRFLPFGPTPIRFDIFAFAAPEALSKRGARVDIDIRLADASLLALVAPTNAAPRADGTLAYGIGSNGLLHSVTVSTAGDVRWRVLTNPAADDGTSVALDGSAGLLALRIAGPFGLSVDIVVAQDASGQLWFRSVLAGPVLTTPWNRIPLDTPAMLADLALVPSVGSGMATPARLLRVDGGELQTIALTERLPDTWTTVPNAALNGPDLAQPVAMAAVQRAATQGGNAPVDTDLVLTAEDGSAWFGLVGANLAVTWTRLHDTDARVDVRPAATHDPRPNGQVRLWVAWADDTTGITAWLGATDGSGGALRLAGEPAFTVAAGGSLRVAAQPWDASASQPLTTAVGTAGGRRSVLVWPDDGSTAITVPPGDVADWSSADLLIVRPPASLQPELPLLVLPARGELLVIGALEPSASSALAVTLHDGLVIEGEPDASHYVELVGGPAPDVDVLAPARIVHADDRVYEVPGGLGGAHTFRFLRRVDNAVQDVDGEARAGGQLRLAATDAVTAVDHRLIIGTATSLVTAIDDTTEPGFRIVTLDPVLAGPAPGATVQYTPVRLLANGAVAAEDRQTLVNVTPAIDLGDRIRFDDGAPALGVVEGDARSGDGRWWRVGQAWTTVPATGTAVILGDATVLTWRARALERGYDNPELSWEFFDGDGWRRLEQGFVDGTQELATSGTVSFRVPATLSPTEIGGREDLWIRARLVGGDYGRPRYVVETRPDLQDPTVTVQSTTIDTSDLHPPEIISIEASFALDGETAPESVLVVANLATLDQTQASAADQARFALFSGARAIDPAVDGRAIYVGLTRQPVSPLVLYAVADDQELPGTLAVDVLTAAGWRRATVDDETGALRRTGLVQVFLPGVPLARAVRFGTDGFWLRLRPTAPASGADAGAWQPVVRGLFVNAVPAKQARTVVQEILGSSVGEPSLVIELGETPVLPDTLELRVREELSADEHASLEDERRRSIRLSGRPASEAPPVVQTFDGIDGTWVLWRRVDSFIGTRGDVRVYRLEPATGRVTFGNGRQGKVPPAGRDAIRAVTYQQGGGRQGNVRAWTELSLKSALEGIEAVVLPADAAGGIDSPDPVTLLHTAPARLRHAGRALAVADYEALAVAAAPQVVRARCAPPEEPGGPIRVTIALRDGSRRPVPSLALRTAVARTLHSAGWSGLPVSQLRVEAPTFVAVTITVRLRVPAALGAQVEQAATAALVQLLHPTDGGPDGRGWPFGRRLWESDVLRTLHDIDGIDRVDAVELARVDGRPLDAMPADGLILAAEGDVDVRVEPVVER